MINLFSLVFKLKIIFTSLSFIFVLKLSKLLYWEYNILLKIMNNIIFNFKIFFNSFFILYRQFFSKNQSIKLSFYFNKCINKAFDNSSFEPVKYFTISKAKIMLVAGPFEVITFLSTTAKSLSWYSPILIDFSQLG